MKDVDSVIELFRLYGQRNQIMQSEIKDNVMTDNTGAMEKKLFNRERRGPHPADTLAGATYRVGSNLLAIAVHSPREVVSVFPSSFDAPWSDGVAEKLLLDGPPHLVT